MPAEENEEFERSDICWICGKLIELSDNKVRDRFISLVNIEDLHIGVVILIQKLVKRLL